jgi:hypothetical protein
MLNADTMMDNLGLSDNTWGTPSSITTSKTAPPDATVISYTSSGSYTLKKDGIYLISYKLEWESQNSDRTLKSRMKIAGTEEYLLGSTRHKDYARDSSNIVNVAVTITGSPVTLVLEVYGTDVSVMQMDRGSYIYIQYLSMPK